jgi:hypothetical protein
MTIKKVVTTSARPLAPRLSAAERRAAQITALASQQAELKQEAAQRRFARDLRADATPPPGPASSDTPPNDGLPPVPPPA